MTTRRKPAQPKPPTTPAATTQGVQHAVVALDSLTPHPRNYRRHAETQVARLGASLARFGQVRSIVVQEGADGRYLLVAGHGIAEAARANGYTELRADVIPATWTPTQIEGYLIADNETTRGADDDLVQLAAMLEEQQSAGYDLDALGYSDEELAALLEELANEALAGGKHDVDDPDGGGDDFDTTPDESGPTRVQPGDIWVMGSHRLMCGDSTRAEDVARLMAGDAISLVVTSPPYFNQRPEYAIFASYETYNQFLSAVVDCILEHAAQPCIIAWNTGDNQADCLPMIADQTVLLHGKGLTYLDTIIWRKNGAVYSIPRSAHIRSSHRFYPALAWEPIIIFRHGDEMPQYDAADEDAVSEFGVNVWDIQQVIGSQQEKIGHPAIFPLQIPVRVMMAYTGVGAVCYEPFGGSGTTMIAGERMDRPCRVMELDPRYCDVILRRWEAETGREATLLERATPAERATEEPAHVTASAHHQ